MKAAYYNENDKFAAAWLRELINKRLITDGEVDERTIHDVQPQDLRGFTRCHFFAGIGGWDYALQLAGWPADRPVWTGSCPCQPFSVAGRGKGEYDERHLWPEFYRLIKECWPSTVFGEQVASKAGREWFSGISNDMERVGYAIAGADLCAASVGAPHIRQRLYWLADTNQAGRVHLVTSQAGTQRYGLGADGLDGRRGDWIGEREPRRFEDGSHRRTKSGVDIMVDGFPGRMELVGGYGNAIVPQVAAEFIAAYMETA